MWLNNQYSSSIQDVGMDLKLSQLAIDNAIVYAQRFYMCHTHQEFQRYRIASAALFLAAKTEEVQDKLVRSKYIVLSANKYLRVHHSSGQIETQVQQLFENENLLLQTLGFDLDVVHPHYYIAAHADSFEKQSDMTLRSKEDCFYHKIATLEAMSVCRKAWHIATWTLLQTTMCLRYSPDIVSGMCFQLAAKWSGQQMPNNNYTTDKLESISGWDHFLKKCPAGLRHKILTSTPKYSSTTNSTPNSTPNTTPNSTPNSSPNSTPNNSTHNTMKRKGDEISTAPSKKRLQG